MNETRMPNTINIFWNNLPYKNIVTASVLLLNIHTDMNINYGKKLKRLAPLFNHVDTNFKILIFANVTINYAKKDLQH